MKTICILLAVMVVGGCETRKATAYRYSRECELQSIRANLQWLQTNNAAKPFEVEYVAQCIGDDFEDFLNGK